MCPAFPNSIGKDTVPLGQANGVREFRLGDELGRMVFGAGRWEDFPTGVRQHLIKRLLSTFATGGCGAPAGSGFR